MASLEFSPPPPRPPAKFVPHPFAYHEVVTLEVAALTNMGQGLGRIDGWVVMVPYALPGETVKARIYRNDKNFSEADLMEVLIASPHRVEPRCRLFQICGGCQYQHLTYAEQLAWKQRQVAEVLQHMARVDHPVEPVIPSPMPYGYRSKITPHFDKPVNGIVGPVGFQKTGRGRNLVDVERCEIATAAINEKLAEVRENVRQRATEFRKGATLLLREAGGGVVTDPNVAAVEMVCGLRFEFLAGDFFQNNPFILESFVRHGVAEAATGGARFLVDAYCGSGLFSLAAAPCFEQVIGVEVSASAVVRATANAAANGIANVTFQAGKAESIFSGISFPSQDTAVLLDPPRAGCDASFLHQLLAFLPRTVVYVSCNPATQMRDLKVLMEGGYAVRKVQPFDLFPQTKHLECVVTLEIPQVP